MNHSLAGEAGLSAITNRAIKLLKKSGYGHFNRADQSSAQASVLGDGGIYSSINDLYHWDQVALHLQTCQQKNARTGFHPGQIHFA